MLAFFASSDGIVLENLAARFLSDVQIPKVNFFVFIHMIEYSIMVFTQIFTPMTWHNSSGSCTRGAATCTT